jgi:uncharacterized protein YjbI with pentapeptide repeats
MDSRFWLKGRGLCDGRRALKQWRSSRKKHRPNVDNSIHGVIPLVPPGGYVPQPALLERVERLRGATDETARLVHHSYIYFLLLGMYIAVIIGSTTDVQLLKISPVTLPLLNVQLPIVGFYIFVPWLLLLLYFNLLLQLTLLAQKLHRLNAVLGTLEDEAAREDQRARLFPFPFSAMLIGRSARWRLRLLLGLMVLTTVILLPLILLLWAQVRFLPYHDLAITWNHRAAVLVDLLLLWLFWPLLLPPVPRTASAAPARHRWRVVQHRVSARRFRWGIGLIGLTLVTLVFSWGIAVLPEEGMERRMVSIASQLSGGLVHTDSVRDDKRVFKLTYWLFETPGAPFHRNLQLQEQVLVAGEPAAEVLTALRSDDKTKQARGLEKITGLILTNRDLRGAELRDTLFPKVDLRGANLKGANLVNASVFAGNLSVFQLSKGQRCVDTAQQSENIDACQTNLQGANLVGAKLQEAYLESAKLQGADLRWAELQGANLGYTELQGANLVGAKLQGADLQGANIGSADVGDANLTWSDLRGLSQSPLNRETYAWLEKLLTDTIRDEKRRAAILKRLYMAVEDRPTNLNAALSDERSVLCDNVELFRFCVTPVQSAEYAHHRAMFLATLGCKGKDAEIARGVMRWHQSVLGTPVQQDPILMAFVKHVTTIPEKDCPGWAAVLADQKDTLRELAAEETSAR